MKWDGEIQVKSRCVCVSKNWTRAWVPGFIFSSAFANWVMGHNSVQATAPQRVEPEYLLFPSSSRKVKNAFFEVLLEFPSILLNFLWTCCQTHGQQVWSWFKVHLRQMVRFTPTAYSILDSEGRKITSYQFLVWIGSGEYLEEFRLEGGKKMFWKVKAGCLFFTKARTVNLANE